MLKRCVLRCCLKVETVEIRRMSAGSWFHTCGAGCSVRKGSGTKRRTYSRRVISTRFTVSEYPSTCRDTCEAVFWPLLGRPIYQMTTTDNHRNTQRIIAGSGRIYWEIPKRRSFGCSLGCSATVDAPANVSAGPGTAT